jgi:hypothetical protein
MRRQEGGGGCHALRGGVVSRLDMDTLCVAFRALSPMSGRQLLLY